MRSCAGYFTNTGSGSAFKGIAAGGSVCGVKSLVAPGTLYVFLAESTLVIDGPGGTPMVGTWRREGDGLVIVEEGIAYETDILELRDDAFRILSHNPGKAVETTMVPAETSR